MKDDDTTLIYPQAPEARLIRRCFLILCSALLVLLGVWIGLKF